MKPVIHTRPFDKDIQYRIRKLLGCTDIMARLLANRGLTGGPETKRFFDATVADITPPAAIRDMDVAVDRLATAVINNEKILVFGDYDADGITATAILFNFLREAGADAGCYLPHRVMEGYGLSPDQVNDPAITGSVRLIITVDCGSGSRAAALACREAGIDLIITDHHQVAPPYPEALAIVNPARPDCGSGLNALSGAGVAFYLLIALRARLRGKGYWTNRTEPNLKHYCDLVAVGTVADIVPLTGENRILVRTGLEMINTMKRQGLKALIAAAGIGRQPLTAEDIAFKIAPRINAAGRIDHGRTALSLLTTADPEEAKKTAALLCKLNTRRQFLEEEIADEITRAIQSDPGLLQNKKMLVMAHHQWHQGVIGIAAARIARKFYRPTALITIKGQIGIGSARSIPGLNLYQSLNECAGLLEDFGGHAQAAGFKIKCENIERFEKQLQYAVARHSRQEQFTPVIEVDCELPFNAITEHLLDELDRMQPFGEQNPEPLFLADNITVVSSFLIKNKYPKMVLTQSPSSAGGGIRAISFNSPAGQEPARHYRRIIFRLQRETWNGSGAPQLIIEQMTNS